MSRDHDACFAQLGEEALQQLGGCVVRADHPTVSVCRLGVPVVRRPGLCGRSVSPAPGAGPRAVRQRAGELPGRHRGAQNGWCHRIVPLPLPWIAMKPSPKIRNSRPVWQQVREENGSPRRT